MDVVTTTVRSNDIAFPVRVLGTGAVRPGDRILMAGAGAGVSYGAVLYPVGAAE